MIPPYSCAVPGKNPGTSTNVTSGMLNASQKRTNRAAFTDALMSSAPAITFGWLATTPDRMPVQVREADHDVHREIRLHLEELAVVDDHADDVLDVVRLLRVVGDDRGEARGRARSGSSVGGSVGRLLLAALRDVT